MSSASAEMVVVDVPKEEEDSKEAPPQVVDKNECSPKQCVAVFAKVVLLLILLWLFLWGLSLMGSAFELLGGKSSGNLFASINNPVAGLMVGILATVLVQSSSTSTSIVVGLVASGLMTVNTAIPIIMGANIGTSVTNTIVSMGFLTDKDSFRLAFAGATVHDMFNYCSVLVLLPLEVIFFAITGTGGMLYHLSVAMTQSLGDSDTSSFKSPLNVIVDPAVKYFVSVDKDKVSALSMGIPTETTCIPKKVVAKISYEICGNVTKLGETLVVWEGSIMKGSLIKDGVFKGMSDPLAGTILLIISLLVLCGALYAIVKFLKSTIGTSQNKVLVKVLDMNGYLAMFVGCILTICVQSSSVVTSALVPLAAIGSLKLDKMLPLTLGANIGTTCTAMLAALSSGKKAAVQIAICHLMFNIFGILLFYPVPYMRRIPLRAAEGLGYLTVCFRLFPLVYVAVAFFLVPLYFLGICALVAEGGAGAVIGWLLLAVFLLAGIAFGVWYKLKNGKETLSIYLQRKYSEREVHSPVPTKDDA